MDDSYARTQILTASPLRLRGLILERSVREAGRLADAIATDNGETIVESGNLLRSLILELLPSVSAGVEPELRRALEQTYLFLVQRVGEASAGRDELAAREVVELLRYEEETWRQVTSRMQATPKTTPPGKINLAG